MDTAANPSGAKKRKGLAAYANTPLVDEDEFHDAEYEATLNLGAEVVNVDTKLDDHVRDGVHRDKILGKGLANHEGRIRKLEGVIAALHKEKQDIKEEMDALKNSNGNVQEFVDTSIDAALSDFEERMNKKSTPVEGAQTQMVSLKDVEKIVASAINESRERFEERFREKLEEQYTIWLQALHGKATLHQEE